MLYERLYSDSLQTVDRRTTVSGGQLLNSQYETSHLKTGADPGVEIGGGHMASAEREL